MTLDDIHQRLALIEAEAANQADAKAHAQQDQLWEDVLRAIAEEASNPAELARVALRANDIEFSRWYA